jgi:hypothetical protein
MKVDGFKRETEFTELNNGDVFIYAGKVYMKIMPVRDVLSNDETREYNSVNLQVGRLACITATRVIAKPKARLLLEGRILTKDERRAEEKRENEEDEFETDDIVEQEDPDVE